MTPILQLFEVARRDFLQRARSRAFLVTMGITVLLVFGVAAMIGLEIGDPEPSVVGVAGDVPQGFEGALQATAKDLGMEVEIRLSEDAAQGEADLSSGDLDVLLVDARELVWAEREQPTLGAVVAGALRALDQQQKVSELGLTEQEAADLLAPVAPESRVVDPPDPEEVPRAIGAQVGAFLLYMSIIIFGQFILLGVMEEKQSRVVEVVISRVPPARLLGGKIIGIGALGLIQIVVLGTSVVLVAMMIDIPDVELPALSAGIVARVALWFLAGYAFYAALYGAMGATVSRQEDAQGSAMIPTLLVVPGLFISLVAIEDPTSLLVTVGSLVPFTSPMVMPVRMATTEVPAWEIAVAALLLLGSTYAVVRAAGRVYRGAVLEFGPKVKLTKAWRSAGV